MAVPSLPVRRTFRTLSRAYLPRTHDLFVGRESELVKAVEWWAGRSTWLTVTGAPGVGKTRFVLEFARDLLAQQSAPEGGVWFVELDSQHDPDARLSLIARRLDIAFATRDGVESVGNALAARLPTLVVLDALSPVSPHDVQRLKAWSQTAPHVRWIVTSTERLHLAGECVLELDPLATPLPHDNTDGAWNVPAVTLLLARANAHSGRFRVTPQTREAVMQLVRELAGLPLALEIAASRLATLDAWDLLERVREGLGVLSLERGVLSRSLERSLQASWSLLSSWEQQTWAQCSVFSSPFRVRDAEAVLSLSVDAPSVLDAVQSLRERSLLQAAGDDGSMLLMLQPVRTFGRQRIEPVSERAPLELRLLRWIANQARKHQDKLLQADARVGLAWFQTHAESTRRALAHAIELQQFEIGDILVAALASYAEHAFDGWSDVLPAALKLANRAGALTAVRLDAAMLCGMSSRLDDANALISNLVLDTEEQRVRALVLQARLAKDADAMRAALQRLQHCATQAHEPLQRCVLWIASARCLNTLGNMDDLRLVAEQIVQVSRRENAPLYEIWGHWFLSLAWCSLGEWETSRSALACVRESAEHMHSTTWSAHVDTMLGWCACEQSQPPEAIECWERAYAACLSIGDEVQATWVLGDLAVGFALEGRSDEARDSLLRALACAERARLDALVVLLRARMAWVAALDGSARTATSYVESVFDVLQSTTTATQWSARCGVTLALASHVLERHFDAHEQRADAAWWRDQTRAFLERWGAWTTRFVDLRCLVRALKDDASKSLFLAEKHAEQESEKALLVDRDGGWFTLQDGQTIHIEHRAALRNILSCLVQALERGERDCVAFEALIRAGWPGEKMLARSARNRLHVAIKTLRDMGLGTLLVSAERGYRLAHTVRVVHRRA